MSSTWIVCKNTIKEILRDRILYSLIIFAVLLVLVSLLLGDLSFAQQEKIITDFGLVAVEIGCCMLAIFVGSSLVFREIEKQTILLLISKPVKRSQFILGKFAGLGAVLFLVNLLMSVFLSLMLEIYGQVHWGAFIVSQMGILLESLLLLAVAIFFGTFARPTMTAVYSLSIWLLGHGMNDLHYFSEKSSSPAFKVFGQIFSRIFPNLDRFNFREAVVYGDSISSEIMAKGAIVWLAWFIILIITSTWIFERRDFI